MSKRLERNARREHILNAALTLAEKKHYTNITRDDLAVACDNSAALISHIFGTMTKLRRDIIRHAIQHENLTVIAQGLTYHDPHAQKAPKELKQKALKTFA